MLRKAATELQWTAAELFRHTPYQMACILAADDEEGAMESADDFLVRMEERARLAAEEEARWTA